MPRATAGELAIAAKSLPLFGELGDLVGVVEPSPLGNPLRPDFLSGRHPSNMADATAVDLRCLRGGTQSSVSGYFYWHVHRSERIAFGVWV